MLRLKKILTVALILFTLFSCRKDFERPSWDVDLLAPLIKTTLTLEDLFPDSIVQTNPDTSIKLVYQTNIFDIDMDSLFKIPDTTITEIYIFPFNSIANPGNSFYRRRRKGQTGHAQRLPELAAFTNQRRGSPGLSGSV